MFAADEPAGSAASDAAWTILLSRVDSGDPEARLRWVQTTGRIPDARLETRSGAQVVVVGRFASPSDRNAMRALERVRNLRVESSMPYSAAVLAPPSGDSLRGGVAEWDLRRVREEAGERDLYTLQVGVYLRTDRTPPSAGELAQFRGAAEAAVAELRAQGEDAYYHHGPSASTVTVGLFTRRDLGEDGLGQSNPSLQQLKRRQPVNLVNGQGVRVRSLDPRAARSDDLQASFLVEVPRR